jgi:hypothetical protein
MSPNVPKGAPAPLDWQKYRTRAGREFVLAEHTPEEWADKMARRLDAMGGVTIEYIEEFCDDLRSAEPA